MKPKRITVLLADDNAAVRRSVRGLLEADARFLIVGEAKNGQEAVKIALRLDPHVILMDISMPVKNGLEATREILSSGSGARIIVLSAYDDEEYISRAKEVGAVGFLAKQMFADYLTNAVYEIAIGRSHFNPASPGLAAEKPKAPGVVAKAKSQPLTKRESRILRHLADGLPKKQIASKLRVSLATIEKLLGDMMSKLGIPSLARLAAFACAPGDFESDVVLTIT